MNKDFTKEVINILEQEFFWNPEQNDAHIRIARLFQQTLSDLREKVERMKLNLAGHCPYQPCNSNGTKWSQAHPLDAIEHCGFYNQALHDILNLLSTEEEK